MCIVRDTHNKTITHNMCCLFVVFVVVAVVVVVVAVVFVDDDVSLVVMFSPDGVRVRHKRFCLHQTDM